jgi:hypothetical protein
MVRIAPSLDTCACKLFHHGTGERGTTVMSNSDAGRILGAFIASI